MMMGSSFIAFFNFVPLKINQQERKCINTKQRRRPSAGASKCALQFSVSSKILFSSSNSTVGTLLILKKQQLAPLFILFYRYDVYKSFSSSPKCSCSRRSLLIATLQVMESSDQESVQSKLFTSPFKTGISNVYVPRTLAKYITNTSRLP